MADLRKIYSIKQKGVDKYGISTFNYSCTAPVATNLEDSTDSNIGPINANSKFRKYYITDQEDNGPLQFSNLACLVDSGNLFADVISK